MSSSSSSQIPDLMEALMKDPAKRAVLLQMLAQEKDGFEAYKRRQSKDNTPVKKLKRVHCESPTALQRRRCLEKLHQDTTSESSSSEQSEACTEVKGPKLPFEQLLQGVRAYVEVRRNNTDRSEGIKAVMKLMGATIKDSFTNDVSHVVFKDGSFTTYQKAKLMKIHLVSVLWLDAVRRNNARVPERNYPAFGSRVCDANVSVLCSQLQKDYEDIIKDEKRRSLSVLPKASSSKTVDKNRRRTMMTPQTSMSSYVTAQKSSNLFSDEDQEVDRLVSARKSKSPEITSDDSECGVIDGQSSKRQDLDLLQVSPVLSDDASNHSDSGASKSLIGGISTKNRKTINVISDMVITPNIDTIRSVSSDGSTNISNNKPKRVLQSSTLQSSMSSLRVSSDSDRTKSGLDNLKNTKTPTSIDDQVTKSRSKSKNSATSDKENCSLTSIGTSMSSLRVSDASDKGAKPPRNVQNKKSGSVANTPSNDRRSQTTSASSSKNHTPSRRSQRISSVSLQSQSKDKSPGSPILNVNTEPRGARRSKRLSSVSRSQSESRSRRSLAFKETPPKISPSPAKKSRVEIKSPKKTRKLYNPNDIPVCVSPPENEKEREEYIKNKSQQKPDDVFVNPNDVLVTPIQKKTRSKDASSEDSNWSDETEQKIKKKTKKGRKNEKRIPTPDGAADEQKDLLALLTNKIANDIEARRSQRVALSQTKPKYHFTSSFSTNESCSSLPITPIKRRSTMDFQPVSPSKRKVDRKQRASSIVCTKMHRPEVLDFEKTVKELGVFFVEDRVSDRSTHLVAGEAKRTINMLKAIARGCWILKREWLEDSKEAGKWLSEEDYELTEFSPSVQQCRLQRQAFGVRYSMDIFKDCGCIYVAKSKETTTPKASDLRELIAICRGKLTTILRNANVVVGEYFPSERVTCVSATWVLDCITVNKLKPLKNYLIKPAGAAVDSPHF